MIAVVYDSYSENVPFHFQLELAHSILTALTTRFVAAECVIQILVLLMDSVHLDQRA